MPLLGSLPIIGSLFRSTGFQHEETELVIIVTPRLVRPVPAGALKAPTDRVGPPNEADLLLNGRTDTGVPPCRRGRSSPPRLRRRRRLRRRSAEWRREEAHRLRKGLRPCPLGSLASLRRAALLHCRLQHGATQPHRRRGPVLGEAVKYNAAIQTINPTPVYPASAAQPGDNGARAEAA